MRVHGLGALEVRAGSAPRLDLWCRTCRTYVGDRMYASQGDRGLVWPTLEQLVAAARKHVDGCHPPPPPPGPRCAVQYKRTQCERPAGHSGAHGGLPF